MHESVMKWTARIVKGIDLREANVLEVGSYNVNGSVRPLFAGCRMYTGVDMRAGPGVDDVMSANNLAYSADTFDIVISTELLEHDAAFWESLAEMGRVLKPGGHLILTARGNGFPLHEYPGDYWRFMPESFKLLFHLAGCLELEIVPDTDRRSPGVFGYGRKIS